MELGITPLDRVMGDFRGPRAGAGGQSGGGLSGGPAYKLTGDHFILKHISAFQLKMSPALCFVT